MWPYWLMFLLPALAALSEPTRVVRLSGGTALLPTIRGAWWAVLLAFFLLVGWRHEVGGDWFSYLSSFERVNFESKFVDWWLDDPGYRLLEWLSMQADWGVHGVNLMGGAVFSYGLVVFCRHLPRPWLALAVAVPYLVIILGMGYSRQGVALGCVMLGLVALGNANVRTFLLWTVLGATFHKSAVLLLPVAALVTSQRRLYTLLWTGVVLLVAYTVLLEGSVESLRAGYLEAEYHSEGALIRLLMNALPAAVLLWKRERFAVTLPQDHLWFWFALGAIGLLGLYAVSPSSTAVDRVGLYLLPLQLMVFANLPEVMGRRRGNNQAWVMVVLVYYAAVEFVWLNYAKTASAWIPYQWYPLVSGY